MKQYIILNADQMGRGDESLGKTIIGAFLKKLWADPIKPDGIILYNGSVRLLTKDGGVLDALKHLEEAGVDLIACGTCVNFFEIKDQVEAGRISTMDEIVKIMLSADKVVTI